MDTIVIVVIAAVVYLIVTRKKKTKRCDETRQNSNAASPAETQAQSGNAHLMQSATGSALPPEIPATPAVSAPVQTTAPIYSAPTRSVAVVPTAPRTAAHKLDDRLGRVFSVIAAALNCLTVILLAWHQIRNVERMTARLYSQSQRVSYTLAELNSHYAFSAACIGIAVLSLVLTVALCRKLYTSRAYCASAIAFGANFHLSFAWLLMAFLGSLTSVKAVLVFELLVTVVPIVIALAVGEKK